VEGAVDNPLATCIQAAQQVDHDLALLFGRYLGSAEQPHGQVLGLYRTGRRALADVFRRMGPGRDFEALDVVQQLRRSLEMVGGAAIPAAIDIGRGSAAAQVAAYQQAGMGVRPARQVPDQQALLAGWGAALGGQIDAALAMIGAQAGEEYLLGDEEERLGALQPAPVNRELSRWLALAAMLGFTAWLFGREGVRDWGLPFRKQVIAAIDERTTECCLRAHGQIQALDRPFVLSGEPRFADRLEWTPFHWWCRSSVVLYLEEFDLGLTEEMVEAALAELQARATTGKREEIHPAHARSRRG